MRAIAATFALLALVGCASMDRPVMSTFEPTDSGFRYKAQAGLFYEDGDPAAEATRMQWLQRYLTDNHLCPNGYKITKRQVVVIGGIGDARRDIFYDGVCT